VNRRLLLLCAMLAGGLPALAHAQTGASLLERGIRANQNLEYDSAAILLRTALGRTGAEALPDSARLRALMYLGATELFRGRRDSAAAAFRSLVLADPRFRPDQLIFPPDVSTLFDQVRQATPAVRIAAPAASDIADPGDRLVLRLYASTVHVIGATLVRPDGRLVRTLYDGAIGDSLDVLWDGRDAGGALVTGGTYLFHVASRGPTQEVVRTIDLPLVIQVSARDTLPWPSPPGAGDLLPETRPGRGGSTALLSGLAVAGFAAAMPSLVAGGEGGSSVRFVAATAAGVAGIVGFLSHRRPQPVPENIAANQTRRLAWERQLSDARAENVRRRGTVRLHVVAGAPATRTP